MPQGFGYGAVGAAFNAVRSGFGKGGSYMAGMGARSFGRVSAGSGMRGVANSLLGGASEMAGLGLSRMSRMGNTGISALGGAAIGGVYGGMSDNGSVLGGALRGAAIGGLGYKGMQLGTMGVRSGMRAYRGGAGLGASASAGFSTMGRASSRFFRSSYNKAVNGFRGMKG